MSVPPSMRADGPTYYERPEEVKLCYEAACREDIDDVNKQVQRLLHEPRWTALDGNEPRPSWLFESLLIAIGKQNVEIVQFLLDEKVVETLKYPFESAVRARAFGVLELFLSLGWDINSPMGRDEPSTLRHSTTSRIRSLLTSI
jgi:hypothetical protein